jgi:hypothetical protein
MRTEELFFTEIKQLIGKDCCRKKIGRDLSLSFGFGDKIYHNDKKLNDTYYGEWEIGSYTSSWRIILNDKIVLGSNDSIESIEEFDLQLKKISFGKILKIELMSKFDIKVSFENSLSVEFICTFEDDDEMFHIFGPNSLHIEYKISSGWKIGKSDEPW